MYQEPSDVAQRAIIVVLVVAYTIVYLIFFLLAALLNKIRGRDVIARRSAGNIGIALLFLVACFVTLVHFAPSLSSNDDTALGSAYQGFEIGKLVGMFAFPGVLVSIFFWLIGKRTVPKKIEK
jgi:hypothetical protein